MALHKNIPYGCNHVSHSLEYANETNRTTISGFSSDDIGRIARQSDNDSFWMLIAISGVSNPVWCNVCGIEITSINDLSDVDTFTFPPVSGEHLEWNGTNWVPGAAASPDSDVNVKVSSNDTTTGYLLDKIVSIEGIQQTELNNASNEDLQLKLDVNGLTIDATPDSAADYLATYDTSAGVHKKVLLNKVGAPLTNSNPVNVTKAAAVVGTSLEAARADHKHDATTATPTATGVSTASSEGSATSLARSDHTHQSNTAPANVTKATAVIGTSGEPARADHKHDITTAAPGATSVATAAADGSSTSLARSDHVHQSNTTPANVTKATAVIGTSGQPARADHKHDITTAAAVELTDSSNAEGTSTSLARADHTHSHGNRGGGSLHALATGSVAGFLSASDKTKLNGLTGADEKVKITANDTTAGYLDNKLLATEGIQKTTLNPASDEDLQLKLDINSLTVDNSPDGVADYLAIYDASAGLHKKVLLNNLPTNIIAADLASVQTCRSTDLTLTTSFQDITLDTTVVQNNTAVVEHNSGNKARIDIKETGLFLINYNATLDLENSGEFIFRVFKNGTTEVSCSKATIWETGTAGSDYWPVSNSIPVILTSGDYITFQAKGPSGSSHLENGRINFSATRLRGIKGDTGATGSGSNVTIKDEGSNVTGTPHSVLNFVGAGVTVTDAGSGQATITISGVNNVLARYRFGAPDFDDPGGSDWPITVAAELTVDSLNASLSVRRFDDTTEEGVGFDFYLPTGATNLTFRFVSRAQTTPGGEVKVQPSLRVRELVDNAAIEAFAETDLAPLDFTTNTNWQYDSETVALATLGLVAGRLAQFEMTRQPPDPDDNLVGDWVVVQFVVEVT